MPPSVRTVTILCSAALGLSALAAAAWAWTADRAEARGLPEVPVDRRTPVTDDRIGNNEAPIPPQCYTRTDGRHNPCYTCHQMYDRREEDRLNQLDDGPLQGEYEFSEEGATNHWTNLFVDRTEWLAAIGDRAIRAYVDQDNYSPLASRLRERGWKGFIPDLQGFQEGAAAFDEQGLARDGSAWVAFNYKPFLGTFWPTNGATDDVVVRLPKPFREIDGVFDRATYFVNLTLVELTVKNLDRATLFSVDEAPLGVDLDGDGTLGRAREVRRLSHYVGDARGIAVTAHQFPQGTELMHSVRYLGLDAEDRVVVPRRMKELRYMRKVNVLARHVIEGRYARERKEKLQGELPSYLHRGDEGFDNGLGWFIKGFIEDYEGNLRPQSYEEDMFCMGCHTSVGTTRDSTFSMARKVAGAEGWGYIDLRGMKDVPNVSEPGGEILNYLRRAGGGSEFRANPEMLERWYRPDGSVDEEKVRQSDVYTLVTPSPRRALDLNKAYTHIVRHQSFVFGRDATWQPPENVLRTVDEHATPLEPEFRLYHWDLRLDWADDSGSRL